MFIIYFYEILNIPWLYYSYYMWMNVVLLLTEELDDCSLPRGVGSNPTFHFVRLKRKSIKKLIFFLFFYLGYTQKIFCYALFIIAQLIFCIQKKHV